MPNIYPAITEVGSSYSVRRAGAKGDGVTDDTNSVLQAITNAANLNFTRIRLPAGTYNLATATTVTFPSGVSIWFDPGAKLNIGGSTTVKFSGDLVAPPQQIFSGAGIGNVQISQQIARIVSVEWWGAVADAQVVTDAQCALTTSTSVSSATANFQSSAQGKKARLVNTTSPTLTGANLGNVVSISQVNSTSAVTLSGASGAAVTAGQVGRFVWGTDSTTAFNYAIAAVNAVGNGGRVQLLPGNYMACTQSIDGNQGYNILHKSNVIIAGAGRGVTKIYGNSPNDNIVYAHGNTVLKIEHLTIDAGGGDNSDPIKYAGTCQNIRITDVEVTGAGYGIQLMGAKDAQLSDCYSHDNPIVSSGGGGCGYSVTDRISTDHAGGGYDSLGTNNIQLTNCIAENCPSAGFRLFGEPETDGTFNFIKNLTLTNCIAKDCATDTTTPLAGFFCVCIDGSQFVNCNAYATSTSVPQDRGWIIEYVTNSTFTNTRSAISRNQAYWCLGMQQCSLKNISLTDPGLTADNTCAGIFLATYTSPTNVLIPSKNNTLDGIIGVSTGAVRMSYVYQNTDVTCSPNHIAEIIGIGIGQSKAYQTVSGEVVWDGSRLVLPKIVAGTDPGDQGYALEVGGDEWINGLIRYRPASANYVASSSAQADAGTRWAQYYDGKFEWGDGTNSRDTFLHRVAVGVLQTDGTFKAAGYSNAFTTVTVAHTVTTADGAINADATAAAFTITLPAANSVTSGRVFEFKKTDSTANVVTIAAAGTDKIDGTSTRVLSSQYQSLSLRCDGASNWWVY